jgi:enoyl-CoA hydratase/carnithine racemase
MVTQVPHLLTEEVDEGILVATLNRPDTLNALSNQTMELLEAALLRFRDGEHLKVMRDRFRAHQRPNRNIARWNGSA